MNKTLLLIICDFLLLNLLALTRWEKAEPTRPAKTPVHQSASTGTVTKDEDLVEMMRLSLADEQATSTRLSTDLSRTEQDLIRTEAEKKSLDSNLQATAKHAGELDRRLNDATESAAALQARLAQMQRELDLKQAEAERQKNQLGALEKSQAEAHDRIENLNVAVKVAEQEKVLLREHADSLKQQVEAERVERVKVQETTVQLAQGVGQLAEKSGELTRELRDNRPLNANVIFNDFLANRLTVRISAERDSLLGKVQRSGTTQSVVVTDGNQAYALFHVDETPFGFMELSHDWLRITAELSHQGVKTEPKTLHFLSIDPRIIAIPLDVNQITSLGVKVYPLALDPVKFPEAMLVSRGGAGYGECPFKLDASQPGYVRMDNRLFKKLVGEFTPTRGDLVFSRTGEFLGIMVSSQYCAIVGALLPARTLRLPDTAAQTTSKILSEMDARVKGLPFSMQ